MYGQEMMAKEAAVNRMVGQGLAPKADRPPGQVNHQIGVAAKLSEALLDSIQRLTARINDVLRSEEPCGTESAKEPCCSVSLAEAMRNNNRRTEMATELINSLIERCEL